MTREMSAFLVSPRATIRQAMEQLEATEEKILFVVGCGSSLLGTLTDGDIRRWILSEGSLLEEVGNVCNRQPYAIDSNYAIEAVRADMIAKNLSCVPIVSETNAILSLLFWKEVFDDAKVTKPVKQIDVPVVVMAGGKGARLDPFTKILPKPLIPIGDKTIIEMILDRFVECGVKHFYLSVNYKTKIIKSYFEELRPYYTIEYIEEHDPLGTAGSLKYLQTRFEGSILVTNCDVIIEADYAELLQFHHRNEYDMTLVASLKHYNIPYGICEIENGGNLRKLTEKPEYSFLVNTGMYVLRADRLNLIPPGVVYHMTDLMEAVKKDGGRIGVFPIGESAWLDTGEWTEYQKALDQLVKRMSSQGSTARVN